MARQDTFSPRYLILSDPSTSPPTPRKQYDRLRGDVEIGRGSKNDSSATDPHSGKFRTNETKVMSARHAKLTWENGRPCLTDVGSTNGTAITREGDKRMLGKGASYRINDGDVITFGRQVDNRQTIVCRPVVLVASFSSEAVFPSSSSSHSSSIVNFARSAAPSIESVPLARSRTLDSKVGEVVHLDDSGDEDEMLLEATQRIPPPTFDNRPATKRVGFGLSEEDVLISAAEEEGDKDVMADESSSDIDAAKTTFMPPRLLSAAASKAESVASIAAVSSLSVRGSPVPEINKELLDELEADLAARACGDLSHSPSVELDGRPLSPVSPEERRSGSSTSRAPSEGVYAASRKLVEQLQPRQRRLRAFLSSDDEAAMLAPAQKETEQDKAEDDDKEDEEELAALPAPSSLFDKPTRDNLESFGFNVNTLDKLHQQRLSSEMDQLSQSGSHLPSPVLSPKSDDEELMAMSDEDEILRPVDMPPPKQQDSPFKLGATSSREASPAVSDLAGSQFFLPTPALATALLSTTDDFRDDLLMGYKSGSEHEAAVCHKDEDEHVSRPGTPVGRGFSPPATSPVERSLKAYLHDLDEQERLVRDAETEEPDQAAKEEQAPSSLFEGEEGEVTQGFASGSTTPGDPDLVTEVGYDVAPLAVKPAPIQIKWTFAAGRFQKEELPKNALAEREERVATPATADEQEEQEEQNDEEEEEEEDDQDSPVSDLSELSGEEDEESADDEDESDPIEDADSDFEADSAAFDPDLDAVDLDVDGAVAKGEDEGMESADEVDERDGMGVEEERWEDGVSEGLVHDEQEEEVEGEKVESEDEDDGYTSDGKIYAPHAFEKPMSPPAEKTYSLPDSPLLDPTMFDGSSAASSSPRKRRLSDTDLEEPVTDSSFGKQQAIELISSSAADNAQGSPDLAPSAGTGTVTLVSATAVEEPAPKRRRIGGGFGFKSFALGLATGMVAAVGGLSYLGGLMEDDL